MKDDQDSEPEPPDSEPQGDSYKASSPDLSRGTEAFQINHNATEAAGETIAIVGESTGRFPRPQSVDAGESEGTGKHAMMVGAGILISRIIGVIRQRVFAYYLGTSDAAGAFSAAFRIPNFLQNVFGEGALSASFIPVYANLLARGDKKEASRVASAVLTLLALVTSVIVLLGVLTTPYIISVVAIGFGGERRDLTIRLF